MGSCWTEQPFVKKERHRTSMLMRCAMRMVDLLSEDVGAFRREPILFGCQPSWPLQISWLSLGTARRRNLAHLSALFARFLLTALPREAAFPFIAVPYPRSVSPSCYRKGIHCPGAISTG